MDIEDNELPKLFRNYNHPKLKRYKFISNLGEGSYGTVFKVFDKL